MPRHYQRTHGFTLIEVILVIGLIGLLAGLAIPLYQRFQVSSELDDTAHGVTQSLRFAQARAMASDGWQAYGVHFEDTRYVVFAGTEYQADDPQNEATDIPSVLRLAPEYTDVVFDRVTGQTSMAGAIKIQTDGTESRMITINELGIIDEQ